MHDPLSENLVFEGTLPIQWSTWEWPADTASILDINLRNEQLLDTLLVMGVMGATLPEPEDPTNDQVLQEIRQLDSKMNLMLGWVGKLLTLSQTLPGSHPVYLGSTGLVFDDAFDDGAALKVNDNILISLYLSEQFPHPLQLSANVISVESVDQGSFRITVNFQGLSDRVLDLLDKFIFRQHRRLVAMSRRKEI